MVRTVGWLALTAGPVAAVAFALAPSAWVEAHYSRALGPAIARDLSRLSGWCPVSVAELGSFVLILLFARAARSSWTGSAGTGRWFRRNGGVLLAFVSLQYAVFVAVWGLNYRREPIAGVFGLPVQPSSADELRLLATTFMAEMALARQQITPSEGVASLARPAGPNSQATRRDWAFERARLAYAKGGEGWPLLSGAFGPAKPILGSIVASYVGIGGIYIPFTGEPHINTDAPEWVLPFNLCHEIAHQHGVAREDEANYVGFRVARDYGEPYFVYSAYFGIDNHVIQALAKVDRDLAGSLLDARSPEVLADYAAYTAWHRSRETPLREVGSAVNSAYLRSNGISDGVQSYGRVVDLLLAEQRAGRVPTGFSNGQMVPEPTIGLSPQSSANDSSHP